MSFWERLFKPDSLTDTASVFIKESQEAQQVAGRLVQEGKHTEAAGYFMNALTKTPGRMELIREYAEALMLQIAKHRAEDRQDDASQQVDWLQTFLRERVLHVSPEEIPALSTLRSEVEAAVEIDAGEATEYSDLEEGIRQNLVSDMFDWSLPETVDALDARLAEIENIIEVTDDAVALANGTSARQALVDYGEKLRLAIGYHAAVEETTNLLAAARAEAAPAAAGYCLQAAESAVRQLAVSKHKLDPARQKRILELVMELEKDSAQLAERRAARDSEAVWNDMASKLEDDLAAVRAWTPPNAEDPAEPGPCQTQIDRLTKLCQMYREETARLTSSEYTKRADMLWEELSSLMKSATIAQQQSYNLWAMQMIKNSYDFADKYTGIGKNEEKIGGVMIRHLSPVDTRVLTVEVQRCYTEVFEYLFQNLKGPKDKDDFERDGRKLMVLKAISAAVKTPLSSF